MWCRILSKGITYNLNRKLNFLICSIHYLMLEHITNILKKVYDIKFDMKIHK